MLTNQLNDTILRLFDLHPPVTPLLSPSYGKVALGQYMTPSSIAHFMASLFPATPQASSFHLLDAGAGRGALTVAFLEKWREEAYAFQHGEVSLFEYDEMMLSDLKANIDDVRLGLDLKTHIYHQDFIESASSLVSHGKRVFSHAILNPPYKKIASNSLHRKQLRKVGIETVNLYSGFVALALLLLRPGGQMVAIIPRSFCNGPYYRHFRDFLMANTAIRHIHIFQARDKAFKDDNVLQENIIISLERDGKQENVTVSQSTDGTFKDYTIDEYPFSSIVHRNSRENFIYIPCEGKMEFLPGAVNSLSSLGVNVSTGPIVDFRLKQYLHTMPEGNDAPLLYPSHFNGDMHWPKKNFKKSNAISVCPSTMKWLYPNGWYVVVRRLSSKEEEKRITASIVNPYRFAGMKFLGFENHLNVFHQNKMGMPESIARGLACYLNSTSIDKNFRAFNGHTQVNATDLRSLLYPSRNVLSKIGEWSKKYTFLSQEDIDKHMEYLLR